MENNVYNLMKNTENIPFDPFSSNLNNLNNNDNINNKIEFEYNLGEQFDKDIEQKKIEEGKIKILFFFIYVYSF